ncbi:MAG TPA: element excision factor XisI family protein [Phototrophicaceae bacterium]|nr:element excision factor XisI family protein [Phototrophicaceae bacterium]
MDTLKATFQAVIEGYTGEGLNGSAYLVHDPLLDIYTVISVGNIRQRRVSDANLIVRLTANKIIIERDMNDKTLVDALVQAGVPRRSIILAYAGEPVPESA